MRIRKNKKRINPRYFLNETAIKEQEDLAAFEQTVSRSDLSEAHPKYGEGYAVGYKRPQEVEGDFIVYYDIGEGKSVYYGFDNLKMAVKEAKEFMDDPRKPKEVYIYSKVETKWGKGHIWGSRR